MNDTNNTKAEITSYEKDNIRVLQDISESSESMESQTDTDLEFFKGKASPSPDFHVVPLRLTMNNRSKRSSRRSWENFHSLLLPS